MNSILFSPFHSFMDILPAILKYLLFLWVKYDSRGLPIELKAIVFILISLFDSSIDLICFSAKIEEFTTLRFWITNLGSVLPDPNGARVNIFL